MPKEGLGESEWRLRLRGFAAKTFVFKRGQHPPPNSKWAKEIVNISTCPKQRGVRTDPFGRPVSCTCGYHKTPAVTHTVTCNQPSVEAQSSVALPSLNTSQSIPPLMTQSTVPFDLVSASLQGPLKATSDQLCTEPEKPTTHEVSAISLHTASVATTSAKGLSEAGEKDPLADPLPLPVATSSTDFSLRLPKGWKDNLEPNDRQWIGRAVFAKKGQLITKLQAWWHPPPVDLTLPQTAPSPGGYFHRRLFLWMPRKMWKIDIKCPNCKNPTRSLRSKGPYNRVRHVLDLKEYYYLAGEYMDCNQCKGTLISWDQRILDQLPDGVRTRFPAVVTHKYACDISVVSLLRSRTLGNSPHALQNNILELHSEEWGRRYLWYLSDCDRHRRGCISLNLPSFDYEDAPAPPSLPTYKWFLASYIKDVWNRLSLLKASMTSVFGRILKIDSTKKVTKKLQGHAANTASWATNVGNEIGEVVISVITSSESMAALKPMADGLTRRFSDAKQDPPLALYTDRECCGESNSKYNHLFAAWPDLLVRLDIYHLMRRFALGVTSESHPLYGVFMSRLSSCIFEWDGIDIERLERAKCAELKAAGIPNPSDSAVRKAITKQEMARHCKRRTRGTDVTVEAIKALLLELSACTDTLGVPVMKQEIWDIFSEQKRHIKCIQDPPGVPLYCKIRETNKGGVALPVFRCARGSTSLESFHLHLARFIPGTSASAVHFQAYLLDGITRWNASRTAFFVAPTPTASLRTFDVRLQHRVNSLAHNLKTRQVFPLFRQPSKYTGELLGMEYLYSQSGGVLPATEDDISNHIDEGIEEDIAVAECQDDLSPEVDPLVNMIAVAADDTTEQESNAQDDSNEEDEVAPDAAGLPGWNKVDRLAEALIGLEGLSVTNNQAALIKQLYDDLLPFDKKPLQYRPLYQINPRGRFSRKYRSGHAGVETMKRSFLSAGSPALAPSRSRLVEAICVRLTDEITQPRVSASLYGYASRWKLVLSEYNQIRGRLFHSKLMEETNIVLFNINETTLTKWYKNKTRLEEIDSLIQGRSLPPQVSVSEQPLPAPLQRPTAPPPQPHNPEDIPEQEDTVGKARLGRALPRPAAFSEPSSDTSSSAPVSRTTEWRQRKRALEFSGSVPKGKAPRKEYSCRVCQQPMTGSAHTQFRGQRYCPNAPGQVPKEEWLALKRAEAKAKKARE